MEVSDVADEDAQFVLEAQDSSGEAVILVLSFDATLKVVVSEASGGRVWVKEGIDIYREPQKTRELKELLKDPDKRQLLAFTIERDAKADGPLRFAVKKQTEKGKLPLVKEQSLESSCQRAQELARALQGAAGVEKARAQATVELEKQNELLIKQRSDWEAVVKMATEEKDKWQREMLDKFVRLLNTKKDMIRQLRERLNEGEEEQEADTDTDEERGVRKKKGAAVMDVDEDDEEEGGKAGKKALKKSKTQKKEEAVKKEAPSSSSRGSKKPAMVGGKRRLAASQKSSIRSSPLASLFMEAPQGVVELDATQFMKTQRRDDDDDDESVADAGSPMALSPYRSDESDKADPGSPMRRSPIRDVESRRGKPSSSSTITGKSHGTTIDRADESPAAATTGGAAGKAPAEKKVKRPKKLLESSSESEGEVSWGL